MDDDWDLNAVVRGCSSAGTAASSYEQDCSSFPSTCFQDPFQVKREELHDLCKPYFPNSQEIHFCPKSMPISPLSDLKDEQLQIDQQAFSVSTHTHAPRSKRRKNHLKKVLCHVAAENLSSDMWSWRKYGQKPIKGSPYPRGYYRCSTSKGCMARKQVERNRSDPAMYIVTYTSDHNHPMPTHRNSLAGTTRQKPAEDHTKPSTAPEKLESSREDLLHDDGDDFSVTNMPLDDDFFAGLEDFTGDCDSDHLPASVQFPWFSTTATTTTAGGG